MPVGTKINLLPYLLEEVKKKLSWFFCRQLEPENIQGPTLPLHVRVKPTRGSAATGATRTLLERYQDYTQTRAAVLSEVSPEKNYANCSNRASAPDAMENRSEPYQGSKQIVF